MFITRSPAEPYLVRRDEGWFEYQLPVSVKAVVAWRGRLPLLRNERDEWELPGGKLEPGEDPASCVEREIHEELGWHTAVGEPVHAWVYEIFPHRHVFVVTYLATYDGDEDPTFSHEHKELALVRPEDVARLSMPDGYRAAVAAAVARGHFA